MDQKIIALIVILTFIISLYLAYHPICLSMSNEHMHGDRPDDNQDLPYDWYPF